VLLAPHSTPRTPLTPSLHLLHTPHTPTLHLLHTPDTPTVTPCNTPFPWGVAGCLKRCRSIGQAGTTSTTAASRGSVASQALAIVGLLTEPQIASLWHNSFVSQPQGAVNCREVIALTIKIQPFRLELSFRAWRREQAHIGPAGREGKRA